MMRTITLELLRHGLAHNHLLSPLTPYLALCGNHEAITLHLPFEHNQLLHRLRVLDYQDSNDNNRLFELQAMARDMGEILTKIPGLAAELNRQDCGNNGGMTHLRLILSASELALLPFELALSPNGCPGTGQHLSLQPQRPICITREVRRAPDPLPPAPKAFKILFAAASPPDVGKIPLEAHILALRKAIDPWVAPHSSNQGATQRALPHLEPLLELLPNASIQAIEEACAREAFSHVHILAHGVSRQIGEDQRFMLALHHADNPLQTDYIDGPRLATALRATCKSSGDTCDSAPLTHPALSHPMIVTLASCNSGGIGSVAGAGASLAHALHEAGIPIVVAGQFPLSFPGSVRLVETLYEGLLWAKDPRWLLHRLRRSLHSQMPKTHDWASLVVYATLSPEFDRQWCDLRIKRTIASIDAAMKQVDHAVKDEIAATDDPPKQLDEVSKRVENATKRLTDLREAMKGREEARICGLLGSSKKRHAELYLQIDTAKVIPLLKAARDYYLESFRLDRSQSWSLVQYLSLAQILLRCQQGAGELDEDDAEILAEQMATARQLAREDLYHPDVKRRIWARGDLIELSLLSLLSTDDDKKKKDLQKNALNLAKEILKISEGRGFEAYSTARQLRRYNGFYPQIATIPQEIIDLARRIYDLFPSDLQSEWS